MNKTESEIINLIRDLALVKISDEVFLSHFREELQANKRFPQTLVEEGCSEQSTLKLDLGIILIRLLEKKNDVKVPGEIWCKLLTENWHNSHEDIAFLLQRFPDPKTVDCLFEAATTSFDYLSYDETFQLSRKCIKALAAIGNEEAIQCLRKLEKNENSVIGGYAIKELNYAGL